MTSPDGVPPVDLELLAARVDHAAGHVATLDEPGRGAGMELKEAIEAFHREGLATIVRRLKADARGTELLMELVEIPAVYALLAMHGLVRADTRTLAARAIDAVRPLLQSHGGDVALVDIRDGRALVSLSGSCDGCSLSTATLRETVEKALVGQVPGIDGVDLVTPPRADGDLLQIVPLAPGPAAIDAPASSPDPGWPAPGWHVGPRESEVTDGKPVVVAAGDKAAIVIRSKSGLRAFRNNCAHAGLPLDTSAVDSEEGTLTCRWHAFRFDTDSGRCLSAPQCRLEAWPLRVVDGVVWVRPG